MNVIPSIPRSILDKTKLTYWQKNWSFPIRDVIDQHDNARCHTPSKHAKNSSNILDNNGIPSL